MMRSSNEREGAGGLTRKELKEYEWLRGRECEMLTE